MPGCLEHVACPVLFFDSSRLRPSSEDSHVIVYDAKTTEIINTITPPPPSHCSSIMDYSVNAVSRRREGFFEGAIGETGVW